MDDKVGDKPYLYKTPGMWAISVRVNGRWIYLIQDTPLRDVWHAAEILFALGIHPTNTHLDAFFPRLSGEDRCPTLGLMELCCTRLDPTNPQHKGGREVGV